MGGEATAAADRRNDGPVIGDPIGREALLDALRAEMIPYTPEELIDIANHEFAWCEVGDEAGRRRPGLRDDWKKALELVSRDHVQPGEQPRLISELAEEATKYVEDHDLVTVPELCKETWRMEMMSPERQKVNPFFTGGEVISRLVPDGHDGARGQADEHARATTPRSAAPRSSTS